MIVTCVEEHMLDTSLKMRVTQYIANYATKPSTNIIGLMDLNV